MAFDETLAGRVRPILAEAKGAGEKKMFGGIAFLVRGNMAAGILGDELVVRIDPAETESALREPGTRIFDITGRPMKGWIMIRADALRRGKKLDTWVRRGVAYAQSLPPK
jgi:TfoX/Sxy family transcriptional regulator of competence genes